MQHPDEGTIHAWLDSALSADEAATVEAHVNGCAQCQAAVAEARGFIAASSRILTALDNVPSGVVPVAKPKRRDRMAAWVSGFRPADPMIWRIAATVLVVAAGTLVVVRNSSLETRSSVESRATPTSALVQADSASSQALETTANAAPAGAAPQTQVAAPTEKKAATTDRLQAIRPRGGGVAGGVASPDSRADRAGARKSAAPAPPSPVPAAAPPPRFQVMEEKAAMSAMNAAAPEPAIRIVGTPRAIGQKITLYEVAPGDTVRLVEPLSGALDAAVVSGASETRMQAGQAKAVTGAAAPTAAAAPVAKVAAPPSDTTRPAAEGEVTSAARRAPIVLRGPATYGEPTGTNTITWADSTGRVGQLSGRHTRAELEAIRRRIERFTASSTPAAPCPSSDSLCRRR